MLLGVAPKLALAAAPALGLPAALPLPAPGVPRALGEALAVNLPGPLALGVGEGECH